MTGIEIAGLVLAAAGAASGAINAQEAKKNAARQARAQKQQAMLQRRLSLAQKRREARIKQAQVLAGTAGGTGSAVTGAGQGIQSTLGSTTDFMSTQGAIQDQQFDLAASSVASEANAAIGQALGSFAATALSPATGANKDDGLQLGETVVGKALGA